MAAYLLLSADARGKKKKKRGGSSGSGPTCASLGLDCSETCCTGSECAEVKLDCATEYKRPFTELYTGFGVIFGIIIGVSVLIGFGNFCFQFKFCQRYDEGLDTYVDGCSLFEMMSCLLTCGLSLRSSLGESGQGNSEESGSYSVDFRKRFEFSMDHDQKQVKTTSNR